jgi:hypothetical protein
MAASRCSSAPTKPANARWNSIPIGSIAAGQLITNRVERGELGKAYQAAQALVKRRPESAQAHFVMSLCLSLRRNAGTIDE